MVQKVCIDFLYPTNKWGIVFSFHFVKKVTGISESRKAKITPAMALENSIIFYKHM